MRKNWKIYGLVVLLIILLGIGIFDYDSSHFTSKLVSYQGNNLRVSIDGATSTSLPTSGTYYLISYVCDNDKTEVSWDSSSYELTVTNGKNGEGVSCDLTFKSNPRLYELPVGSYVAYTGSGGTVGSTSVACQTNGSASSSTASAETEAPNSCSGQNAREDLDTSGYTYGYCYIADYKYYTTGWRIAYIDTTDASNPRAILISAGSPECNSRKGSTANVTYIQTANAKALKYCNTNYVDGNCTCTDSDADGLCDSPSTDAWAINDFDFYYMTKAISGYGKRLSSSSSGADSSLGDSGGSLGTTLSCGGNYSYQECGYNNDLLDNGGFYWFADRYSSSDPGGMIWRPSDRNVYDSTDAKAYGLRPIIRLSSSVYVTGGKGTMDAPYTVGNNSFWINNGSPYINSSVDKSNVTLNLMSSSDVSQMCVSVGTSECSNYVNFASTYMLDWSSESDGEKIVYVHYKNAVGEVVASKSRSVIVDTVAPSNSSVTFVDGDGMFRTLTLSSTGADYMCFSNTSSSVSDCTKWVGYQTSYSWFLSEGTGSKTIYAFFKDRAGNVVGPYSASTTCTNDCSYKYFIDAYNNSYIYLMRNDGATTRATTSSTGVTWYSEGSQKMNVCGAYNYSSSAYIWCIGNDNNTYYKTSYNSTSWTKVDTSSYIDTSTYTYSIYPYNTNYAYIARNDGKINRLSSSGLASTSWSFGVSSNWAVCSGYSSSRVICLNTDGYYYYGTKPLSNTAYTGGSIIKLSDRTFNNSWIDMYSSSYTNIIESDGTSLYTTRFSYSASSATWYTSTIPGNGVKTCASGGSSNSNYCLADDGYLYYKSYSATSWTKSTVLYE